jgi:hypothetical protein
VNSPADSQPQEFALEVLRAEHGDCLLLKYGDAVVLIDGGPSGVYDAALKPRLEQLMDERGRPLWLQMVMVSHIDDDHIVGLADMFAEARELKEEQRGQAEWQAGELWFNAFGELTGAGAKAATSGVHAAALQALVASAPGEESKAVAVGVASGVALQEDASHLGVDLNKSVGGGLVQRGGDRLDITVVPGLTFTVVAPAAERVTNLRARWEEWEREHPRADAEKAANVDRSVFNLSSIAVLAEADGRSMLLTGDARSDDVLAGLEASGLVASDGPPLEVDVLKIPHHGSIRNVDEHFFDRVRARHYVISANGRDGNPEDKTLDMICDAPRDAGGARTLWLTYGGQPGDGKPGLHERLDAFLTRRKAQGPAIDVRFAKPGEWHTVTP